MTDSILIADDDTELCDLLKEYLESEGFAITLVHNGNDALPAIEQGDFQLVILDIMLPGMNGLDTLRSIREKHFLPVLMLTARGEEIDRIVGLELGADDYVPKPCNPRELLARIRAIIRRTQHSTTQRDTNTTLCVGSVQLTPGTREAYCNQQLLSLTAAEFMILKLLLDSAGEVVSKETLSEQALSRKLLPFDRSIDVHMSNLRRKLRDLDPATDPITNVRGLGYLFKQATP